MNIKKEIQRLKKALTFPQHGAAIDMVKRHWDPDFSGDVRDALSIMHEKTMEEAERLENNDS